MAEKAVAVNCPSCGTLTACSGGNNDATLVGRCALGHTVTAPNHRIERHEVEGATVAAPTYVQVKDDKSHVEAKPVVPAPPPAPTWGAQPVRPVPPVAPVPHVAPVGYAQKPG